jgi:SulP family sulfate permease
VSTNTAFEFNLDGLHDTFVENFPLIGVVLVFEFILRLLIQLTREENGRPRYPLLGPIYYICITPVFYILLACLGISSEDASNAGFFFPSLESGNDVNGSSSIGGSSLFDIFTIVNFSTISWTAVAKSIPTIVSLTAFSLIHVPINIPAFAISSNVEPDMDRELVAHGWSNAAAGLFGGLQNYMAYSNSVIYSKSGGKGIGSSLSIVAATIILFIVGPTITSFVPRCMAGTLLLHIGIDLFLEGVKDSYGDYDTLEYSGIWLITIVMVVFGMSAALIAGAVAALSVYLVQSITHQNPIKGQMSAVSLRSSAWNRSIEAREILEDKATGRHRIHLILLQGHIFFGNVFLLLEKIKSSLEQMCGTVDEPKIVIIDFTSVLGLDSSAAQAIAKLKTTMHNKYGIVLSIFVTGSTDGFPCEYNLSEELSESVLGKTTNDDDDSEAFVDDAFACLADEPESTALLSAPRMSMSIKASAEAASSIGTSMKQAVLSGGIPSSRVCDTLDEALVFAEDVLIALEDSFLLEDDLNETTRHFKLHRSPSTESAHDEEKLLALRYLEKLCPLASGDEVESLLSAFTRERFADGDVLWSQGSSSDCCKLLVMGNLLSRLEDGSCMEDIAAGSTIGELGLVHKTERLSTVTCVSDRAVLFSLSRESWEDLLKTQPALANHILHLVVRYLAHRVQHVSNRVLESRSLPV